MKKNKLLVTVAAGILLAVIGVVSGAVFIMLGSVDNQECVNHTQCDGTVTNYSGSISMGVSPTADLSGSVGKEVGGVSGGFDFGTWGQFDIIYDSGATRQAWAPLTLVPASQNTLTGFLCSSGAYKAQFASGTRLYNDVWGDMGFSLSGSYYCLQSDQHELVLSVHSPELGSLANYFGTGMYVTENPNIGLTFNGIGILSKDSNNVEGIRAKVQESFGQDPFTFGSQSLAAVTYSLTKYDFNVDVGKNMADVTRYLRPWTKASLPASMGGILSNGVALDATSGPNYYNQDEDSPGTTQASAHNQVVWFDLNDDSCAPVGNNSGCTVRINGGVQEPIAVVNAVGPINDTLVEGSKMVIVDGGNLLIDSDMHYGTGSDMVVFVVRRSREDPSKGGNVYIDPRVTNVVGSFIIDGAFMNYDGSKILSANDPLDLPSLRRQLLIYGSIASANSIGGSLTGTSLCDPSGVTGDHCSCPYGTDWEKQHASTDCTAAEASKYDLAALRKFTLQTPVLVPPQINVGYQCLTGASVQTFVPQATDLSQYDETLYAWAGKKRCYVGDVPNVGAGQRGVTTAKENPTVIEFNKAIVGSNIPLLRKKISN